MRTKEETERIKQSFDLHSFSLSTKDEMDIYDFEGENFRNKSVPSTFINLPARTKKRVATNDKEKVVKVYCPYQDFQLYNVPALQVILERENQINQTKKLLKKVCDEVCDDCRKSRSWREVKMMKVLKELRR